MFSQAQKQKIASDIEALLLSFSHPEMPTQRPRFALEVQGKEDWSYAVIKPNWTFDESNKPGINPWNEAQDKGDDSCGT